MKDLAKYIVAILVLVGAVLAGWFVLKLLMGLVLGAVSRTVLMLAVGGGVLLMLGVVAFKMRTGSKPPRL
ncbi:MAG: hypothetical protein ACYCW6_04725 [Candidatus Xenobia bacterium]